MDNQYERNSMNNDTPTPASEAKRLSEEEFRGIASWFLSPGIAPCPGLAIENGRKLLAHIVSIEANNAKLAQLVCDFQAASMLGTPDDPDGIKPGDVEAEICS